MTSLTEQFTGLPAYSNCTFSVSARPSQGGLQSPWTSYTHLTAEQGQDNLVVYLTLFLESFHPLPALCGLRGVMPP